ncbi:hypothetical protein ALI144C_05940 [Actinosynnema sp. ALI-1.44]|nr:hypothetical protein ALI144C_05940 [Actinosynnema sp. ALI-1.44]
MNSDAPILSWTIEPGDDSTIVHVNGDVDMLTEHEFGAAVRAALDTPAPIVILDLGEVTFLGSIGIHTVVMAHDEACRTERTLRVVEGAAAVRRVMDVTGLNQVLSLHPTVDHAQSA